LKARFKPLTPDPNTVMISMCCSSQPPIDGSQVRRPDVRLICPLKPQHWGLRPGGYNPWERELNEMQHKTSYLGKTIFFGVFLMFGCSSSGAMGCGSSEGGPTVDSDLLGVYQIDSYQVTPAAEGDPDVCDNLSDANPPNDYLALYSFRPNDDLDEARLGAVFCGSVDDCRRGAAQAPEPIQGYSFSAGNDEFGWRGWGVEESGVLNDQCRVDVQAHTLISTAATIDIQTRTLQTLFDPRPEDIDGNNVTCRVADAISSLNDNLPCIRAFSLQATFEAGL
jgi:hypothetical protein